MRAALRGITACVLLWPLCLHLASGVSFQDSSQAYLLPVLYYGPNNQLTGLKEVLALGRVLKRTVILVDLAIHSADENKGGNHRMKQWSRDHHRMSFQELFDVERIRASQSVVLISELKQQGWSGRVDLSVWVNTFKAGYLSSLQHDLGVKIVHSPTAHMKRQELCYQPFISNTTDKFLQHKVVAVSCFEDLVPHAGYAKALVAHEADDLCTPAYAEVMKAVVKSDKVRSMADEFIRTDLGSQPFAAFHVRPYPDVCLDIWSRSPFNEGEAQRRCHTKSLYANFTTVIHDVLQKHSLSRVFIIAHPNILPTINETCQRHNLPPATFLSLATLERLSGWYSTSFLAMLEEEVAERAAVFVGTEQSSMTGVIAQGRTAHGRPADTTLFFPVNPDDYARVRRRA